MKYVIFGAGESGKRALHFLGYWRTECFITTQKAGGCVDGKEVRSYSDLLAEMKKGSLIVVIASDKYRLEMLAQIKKDEIPRFLVFRDRDLLDIRESYAHYQLHMRDEWKSNAEILTRSRIEDEQKIGILGNGYYLPYLIAELAFLVGIERITGYVETQKDIANETGITMGIRRMSYEECMAESGCILIYEHKNRSGLVERVLEEAERGKKAIDLYQADHYVPQFFHPELAKYKGLHRGQRCFIIGNGPSLRAEDLELLYENQEICFAFNKIFKLYPKTRWRPRYYGISDAAVMPGSMEFLQSEKAEKTTVFLADEFHRIYDNRGLNAEYFHMCVEDFYPNYPGFSDDITKAVYFGYTVAYDIGLQFAAYMGFSEIYLLGVDNSFTENLTDKDNHFTEDYFEESELERYKSMKPHPKEINRAYEKAARYAKTHGFCIYNATRGGCLEAFERVDFDSLFS